MKPPTACYNCAGLNIGVASTSYIGRQKAFNLEAESWAQEAWLSVCRKMGKRFKPDDNARITHAVREPAVSLCPTAKNQPTDHSPTPVNPHIYSREELVVDGNTFRAEGSKRPGSKCCIGDFTHERKASTIHTQGMLPSAVYTRIPFEC